MKIVVYSSDNEVFFSSKKNEKRLLDEFFNYTEDRDLENFTRDVIRSDGLCSIERIRREYMDFTIYT